jgi:cellulose synthase/poly-beta-1,6-N-acetylglucosamine synthase-like glycosyltransferase
VARVNVQFTPFESKPGADRVAAERLTSFVLAAGVPLRALEAARILADRNGTGLLCELCLLSTDLEVALHAALARKLGVPFIRDIDPDGLLVDASDPATIATNLPSAHLRLSPERTLHLLAPSPAQLEALFAAAPLPLEEAKRTALGSARDLREALLKRAQDARLHGAVTSLMEIQPSSSAAVKVNGFQGWLAGVLVATWPWFYLWRPSLALLGLHLVMSVFFLSCVALRFLAVIAGHSVELARIQPFSRADLPGYTVMVALHRESEVAAQLVGALKALKWPRSRLDILLVCEADDPLTIDALKAAGLAPNMRIVPVPGGGPRTKPKALMYALPLVRTPYLVLFDAEDRPHPDQILEAWQTLSGNPELACVQAPLEISNSGAAAVARLFAVEYAALFRALLPFLAKQKLYVPLGGTSNHFKVDALRAVGGWDPYNMTEDADIGLRLQAGGYRVGVIGRPTLEDAPESVAVWLRQRTRWMKGFLQTWVVALRHPRRMTRAIGRKSFVVVNVMLGGVFLSALSHPIMLGSMVWQLVLLSGGRLVSATELMLFAIDMTSVISAYLAFMALAWTALQPGERLGFWKVALLTPLYWIGLSAAAWRALWQFIVDPHSCGLMYQMHHKRWYPPLNPMLYLAHATQGTQRRSPKIAGKSHSDQRPAYA